MPRQYAYHVTVNFNQDNHFTNGALTGLRMYGALSKIDAIAMLRTLADGMHHPLGLKDAKDLIEQTYTSLRGIRVAVEVTLVCNIQGCEKSVKRTVNGRAYCDHHSTDEISYLLASWDGDILIRQLP